MHALQTTIISDAEISIQIEEEQELAVSIQVEDVPFEPKSESNEEWISMEEINQSKAKGKDNIIQTYYNLVICPVQMIFKAVKSMYCRKLKTNIPKRTSFLIYIGFVIQSSLE